jgi:hypothetical protein
MARENAASFRQGNSGRQALPNMGIPTEGEAGGLAVKLICKVGEGVLARLGRVNEYACLGYGRDFSPALVDFCELTGIKAVLP